MKMKWVLIIGTLLVCVLIYNHIQISKFYVNKPVLYSSKLSKELRITQISDYHANYRIDKDRLLRDIREFAPHIIVLTGDLIDSRTKDIKPTLELIEDVISINKNVFYVNGNHELGCILGDEFISSLKAMGVTLLENTREVIDIDGEGINMCGVGFYISQRDYKNTLERIDEKTLQYYHPIRLIDLCII